MIDFTVRLQTIAKLLDMVRGAGQRFPDIGSELNDEYAIVTRARDNVQSHVATLGNDNAPYETCAKVLDEVKQIILHLVKMLEVCAFQFRWLLLAHVSHYRLRTKYLCATFKIA